MMELIGLCLLIAILTGLIIVWMFSNIGAIKVEKSKALNTVVPRNGKSVDEIESAYVENKNQLDRLIDESIVCRHQLLQTTNSLIKKADELNRIKSKLEEAQQGVDINNIESNNELLREIRRLGDIIEEKEEAISSFKRKSDEFSDDTYMHISKDQFSQIEKKLKEHKSRVDILENENSKLLAQRILKKEPRLLEDMKLYISNFRERVKA